MNISPCKITVHLASSLDGYMASKDGRIDWMETKDHFAEGLTAESSEDFLQTVDCFIMGAKTYELALKLGWPYGDMPCYVLTHRDLSSDRSSVRFHQGDLVAFVNGLIRSKFTNVWVVGGASVIADFIRWNLVDEINLSVLPVLLGEGLAFMNQGDSSRALHLKKVVPYQNGVVELCYSVVRPA